MNSNTFKSYNQASIIFGRRGILVWTLDSMLERSSEQVLHHEILCVMQMKESWFHSYNHFFPIEEHSVFIKLLPDLDLGANHCEEGNWLGMYAFEKFPFFKTQWAVETLLLMP